MGQSHGPQPRPGASFCKARVDGGHNYQADIHSSPCVVPEKPRLQCSRVGEGPGGGPCVSSMLKHPLPPHLFLRAPGGGAQPKLPHPGVACVGFVGEMLTGGTRARPLVQPLRCHQSLACFGPGRRPVPPHPAPPGPRSKPTSPGIRYSRHCGCRRNGSHHRAVTCVTWPMAGHVRVDQGGLDTGPAKGREGWELNTVKPELLWDLTGMGQPRKPQHWPQPPWPWEGQLDDAFGKPSTAGLEASAMSIMGGNKTH